jgi:hypothetical protein
MVYGMNIRKALATDYIYLSIYLTSPENELKKVVHQ